MKKIKKVCIFFLLVLLSGCGWFGDDTYTKWSNWTQGILVALMSDSLAIMKSVKIKELCSEKCSIDGCWDNCEIIDGRMKLFMVNYRHKIEPLLEDTLNYWFGISGQVSDSTVYGFDESEKEIAFWKIGEKPIIKKVDKNISNCFPLYFSRIRQWKNEKFLILPETRNENGLCDFAILDTASGIITQGLFEGNEKWLAECEDITLIDEKVVCLRRPADGNCGIEMLIDNNIVDSLSLNCNIVYPSPFFIFYGMYIIDNVYYGALWYEWKYNADKIHKVSGLKFQLDYPETWIGDGKIFYDSLGNGVSY